MQKFLMLNAFKVSDKYRKAIYVQSNKEVRSLYECCHGKAVLITYSESVSITLFMKHPKRMRHAIFSPVTCRFYQNFLNYHINRAIFKVGRGL